MTAKNPKEEITQHDEMTNIYSTPMIKLLQQPTLAATRYSK